MSAWKKSLIVFLATIFTSPSAFGQKTDNSENSGANKAAEQQSEQGKDNANAQWSEGATRGQDRAAKVRSDPEQEKEQTQDMKKESKDKEGKGKQGEQPKKNNKGNKK